MSCPVVKAIGEIYGAGVAEESPNVIKVGGYEVIIDEMSFYIARRKLALARLELRKPSEDALMKFYEADYAKFSNVTYKHVFAAIFPPNTHLYNKFTSLVDILGEVEDTLQSYVRANVHNLSIPSLMLLPLIDRLIMYNHAALTDTVNKIVDYINRFSIDGTRHSVPYLEPFNRTIDMTVTTPTGSPSIISMRELLDHELIVAAYARDFEKYQVDAINHMDKVFDICKKIIDMMTSSIND